ncbi:Chaperone protein DnaJ [Fusobacterium necrophorum subsp. funduliforme]|uniref:J domain-containing protein n=1 Tax=Fusobacterium necrophorum TaxID=859 RepID=UPI001B8AECC3|nr:DnaJ domain-containing protein [Fusobacterium necrophorum]MBR8722567.1 Chaperone protein DnaJ [Fusobacterium necrophorum subsp. funduliforme]
MNNGFLILMLIIAILAFSGRIQGLSGLLIFGLILFFLGWFTIKFFWIILAIVGINYLTKSMRPKTQRRTQYTYRTYTQQDFEDFFRRAAGSQYGGHYQRRSSESYGNPYATYMEDLTKYYMVLGVAKGANKEEVKKAYLKKVKEHHPDRFTNASEGEKKYHEEQLKSINEAYDKIEKSYTV